ncbi:MAG: NAD(P)H-hydrate epimerase, partial [Planctomycetota bacterium]
MEPLSRAAIRDLDRRAVERLGLPSIVLMENAGKALAAEAARRIRGLRIAETWVLCGKGNNGGD